MATISDIQISGAPTSAPSAPQPASPLALAEYRKRFPAYAAWPDDKLARGLYKKYAADKMSEEEFYRQIGYQPPGLGERLGNWFGAAGLGAAQGATFGFSDELEAGLRSLFDEGSYTDYLAEARERYGKARERNPTAFVVGDIAGSVAVPSFGVGAAMKLPTLLAKYGALAGIGAGYGALSGAGYATGGIKERLPSAAVGAGIGAITAPAAGALFSWLGKQVAGAAGARNLTQEAALSEVASAVEKSPFATKALAQLSQDEAMTEAQKIIQIGRAAGVGDEALYDLSLNLRELYAKSLKAAGAAPIEAAQELADTRVAGMGDTVAKALDDAMGNPASKLERMERVRADAAGYKPLFAAADPLPIPTKAMGRLASDDIVLKTMNSAANWVDEARSLPKLTAETMPEVLPTSLWQKTALDLGEMGQSMMKRGNTLEAKQLFAAADKIQTVLKELNPNYAEALKAFGPEVVRRNAARLGRDLVTKTAMSVEDFGVELQKVIAANDGNAEPVLRALKEGLAEAVAPLEGAQLARKVATPKVQKMLAMVLQPDELAKLNKGIKTFATMGASNRAIKSIGSATGRADLMSELLGDRIPMSPQGLLSKAARIGVNRMRGMSSDVGAGIAELLQTAGPDKQKVFEALAQFLAEQQARTAPLKMGAAVGGRAVPGLLGATGAQY